jgi:serine kinase
MMQCETMVTADIVSELALHGYQLGKKLGEGSSAEVMAVHKAEQPSLGLAVKILPQQSRDKGCCDCHHASREVALMRQLRHPNVIALHEVVEADSFTAIVMERADGGDLLDHIINNFPLDRQREVEIFQQLLAAVEHCHSKNIAHRDLKCENILMDAEGQVKLADFGFARCCRDPQSQKRVLSQTFCGSLAYLAPEVLSGQAYNPLMADIWSLGVVLFIMKTLHLPFGSEDPASLLHRQLQRQFTPGLADSLNDQVDAQCQNLIRHLLEPDVTQRATLNSVRNSDWLKHK